MSPNQGHFWGRSPVGMGEQDFPAVENKNVPTVLNDELCCEM
jgi:hypothetical protein